MRRMTMVVARLAEFKQTGEKTGRLLAQVLRTPLSDWESALNSHKSLLDDSFFETLSARLESALVVSDNDRAICLSLVGDVAGRVRKRSYRFGFRVTKELRNAPWVPDRRDESIITFPGSGYRAVETIVPLFEASVK